MCACICVCVCVGEVCMLRIVLVRSECITNKIQNNIIMYNKCTMKLKERNMLMNMRKRFRGWAEYSKLWKIKEIDERL